jgi:hypothetical protein
MRLRCGLRIEGISSKIVDLNATSLRCCEVCSLLAILGHAYVPH